MPYRLSWREEKQVMVIKVWGTLDIDEIIDLDETYLNMIKTSDRYVISLVDATQLERIPFDVKLINQSVRAFKEPHTLCVIATDKPLIRVVAGTLGRLARKDLRVVPTLEAGEALLQSLLAVA